MYTKDDLIYKLSSKQKWEMVTIEFINDVEMNKKNRWTKQPNRFYKNVKKYHKLKCVTTYDYEEEKEKYCSKYWKTNTWIGDTRWNSININPHIIHYTKDWKEKFYLQVVPVELLEYYYLLNGQRVDENLLKQYLPQKDGYWVVIRIKLEDIQNII